MLVFYQAYFRMLLRSLYRELETDQPLKAAVIQSLLPDSQIDRFVAQRIERAIDLLDTLGVQETCFDLESPNPDTLAILTGPELQSFWGAELGNWVRRSAPTASA